MINAGSGLDTVIGIAGSFARDNDTSATGILSQESSIITARGSDELIGEAVTGAIEGQAYANGIRNVNGSLSMGSAADRIEGRADAGTFGRDFLAMAFATGIFNEHETAKINTGRGADSIFGHAFAEITAANDVDSAVAMAAGIENQGQLLTGAGNDAVFAEANASADGFGVVAQAVGLKNNGTISMSQGKDEIRGVANTDASGGGSFAGSIGIDNGGQSAEIQTGSERDLIHGTAIAEVLGSQSDVRALGVANTLGLISTGDAGDVIIGEATISLYDDVLIDPLNTLAEGIRNNSGRIDTGRGDDIIRGEATVFGGSAIAFGIAGGVINTGSGHDQVIASSFGRGVQLLMGSGNDLISGFGEAIADGGSGNDQIQFDGFDFDDFVITPGNANANEVCLSHDGVTMSVLNFEQFIFDDGTYTYSQVVAQ